VAKVEWANVVEPKDVIGVAVRDQHCIEMSQAMSQRLLAKVRRRINNYGLLGVFDQHSQSQAIEGTPVDVPVPRNVSFIRLRVQKSFSIFHFPFPGKRRMLP
jgi:hypothetical protein